MSTHYICAHRCRPRNHLGRCSARPQERIGHWRRGIHLRVHIVEGRPSLEHTVHTVSLVSIIRGACYDDSDNDDHEGHLPHERTAARDKTETRYNYQPNQPTRFRRYQRSDVATNLVSTAVESAAL